MIINTPPETNDLRQLKNWCYKLHQKLLEEDLSASTTWNPGNIAANADEHKEVTVPGAELGDYVIASFSLALSHLVLTAEVSAANTVEVQLFNHTGGAIDLAEGTLYVRVFKRTFNG